MCTASVYFLGFAHPTRLPPEARDRESGAPLAELTCHRHINRVQHDGGRMIGEAVATIRKWTETARAARVPGIATALDALEWVYGRAVAGVPGLDGAEALAVSYAGHYATTDEAVARLIAGQSGKAGVAGFVTGCGGAIAVPVALPVNLLSTLYIQLRLVAAIAHLLCHDLQSDEVSPL